MTTKNTNIKKRNQVFVVNRARGPGENPRGSPITWILLALVQQEVSSWEELWTQQVEIASTLQLQKDIYGKHTCQYSLVESQFIIGFYQHLNVAYLSHICTKSW